ncbi:sigma E protease regulator RseP [Vibrio mangrovi]|uniref:Zinc metalloprotease n=1 Tax=Vibrio mangrovi TaxID=474394 RepID=A0A1Y6IV31_9VIBR|nr:sigma E protease regulator RseP [Vibrio mangrovi]MDW6001621.1 sigma E protease regulator RseP [Vibrio mangrovi]SMS00352.1 Regulator of sigma-E protease RseP [Vibrio mangrovi]
MNSILWNLVSFILALGILVAVHEFGHFWVARRCGVKVEKFSIGFGRSIWRRMAKDGTEYSLSIIPLGGYVKMLDSRIADVPEHLRSLAFDQKPLWKRTAIVAAGPVFNFLFAIFAYWAVFCLGIPAVKPVVGDVAPVSIAADAGLHSGMEIQAVSGVNTADWESVNMELISHIGDAQMTLTVHEADSVGHQEILHLDLSSWNFDPEKESPMKALGFRPYSPKVSTILDQVVEGGAGAEAGLTSGDEIIAINGKEVSSWPQVVQSVQNSPDKTLNLSVLRNGQHVDVALIPGTRTLSDGRTVGFAGISPSVDEWPANYRYNLQFGVFESIPKAVEKTGQVVGLTISMLKKLLIGDVGLNNLSGPISIAKGAGTTAEYGLVYFLGFLALISINLGIINLVPLPMLDGGHLMFFAIEAVTRHPVPERVQEIGYRIGGAIIFSLMAIAMFNDFTRL